MDKIQLTGQNLGLVFNFRNDRVHCYSVKLHHFKLKTQPKQLLGSLPLDITIPITIHDSPCYNFLHNRLGTLLHVHPISLPV